MGTKPRKSSMMFFNLKRFAGFLKVFVRNRRALFGLAIILFFLFLALAAPILTPYNALGEDPSRTGDLAGRYAAPEWLRYLPTWLGGSPSLSQNMAPIQDPGQPKLWPDGQWNFSVAPTSNEGNIVAQSSPDVGYPYVTQGFQFPNENGSLAVTYERPEGSTINETTAYVYTDFYYPYSGRPTRLIANFELLANGTVDQIIKPTDQWYIIQIKGARSRTNTPTVGNFTITTNSASGLYLAASTDINQYFGNNATWASQGYQSWEEWVNGTVVNGTSTLPGHWSQMNWTASEGSQTNQTDFNISQVRNWTTTTASLTNASIVGDTVLYLDSVPQGFKGLVYVTVGTNETEEANQIIGTGTNYIQLKNPLMNPHGVNETVMLTSQSVTFFNNLSVAPGTNFYVLVRVTVTSAYDVFDLSIPDQNNGGISPAIVLDENLKFLSPWEVVGRTVKLNVPFKIRVFFGPSDKEMNETTTLFPSGGVAPPLGFFVNSTTLETSIVVPSSEAGLTDSDNWIISRDSVSSAYPKIDRQQPSDLLNIFQPAPGTYRFGIEITFLDTGYPNQNVSTTLNVDDLSLRLYGTSFGLLGADQYGRDLYSQLIYGTRISLYIGVLVAIVSVGIGLVVGLLAGYMGGAADQFLMRFNDLMLVLPSLPLMIVLVAVLGASINNLIVLLGFLGWNGFARLVRSQVLSLKERPFIESAKASGAGTGHIVLRHIMPHVMALVYISLATAVPGAITTEAALSFLGFYDPFRMSWGRMLNEVFTAGATGNWWWIVPPGLCIALLAMAFILLGFALDELLNPKLRQRR